MHGFMAIVFDGKDTAFRAFRTLEVSDFARSWKRDVAVVSRNEHGAIHAHGRAAEDDGGASASPGFGRAPGAMLSLVYGMSALIGASAVLAFEDPAIKEFAKALTDDSSALLLFADEAALADFANVATPFRGKVIRANVREPDLDTLARA